MDKSARRNEKTIKLVNKRTKKHAAKQQLLKQLTNGEFEDLPIYEPKSKRK